MTRIARSTFDKHCLLYPKAFSHKEMGNKMTGSHFSKLPKRGPSEKCNRNAPWKEEGSRCSVIDFGEDESILGQKANLTTEQIELYSSPKGIIELNKEGILTAVDKRVSLFFEQAILCYNMPFRFSASGADSQIGSAPKIRLSGEHQAIEHKREAAHSSTIPTLMAHPLDGSIPNGFVYLKGSSSYDQHNATIGMNECVNGADELLDGKGDDEKLRDKTVQIINKVAQASLNPVEATKIFLKTLLKQIAIASEKLEEDDKRLLVLNLYKETVKEIQSASKEKGFFDLLLGVKPGIHQGLRASIYKKRFDVILLQESIESRFGKRIEDLKKKMGRDRNVLVHVLLHDFQEKGQVQVFEKLSAKTAASFEATYGNKPNGNVWLTKEQKQSLERFKKRVTKVKAKYSEKITLLEKELRKDFREMSCAEMSYRSGLFKDLRKAHHWTQKQFCEHYASTNNKRISQSWVSRMEQLSRVSIHPHLTSPMSQRRRYLTLEDAENCAKTFGVDPGVFLPCLFTSS